VDLLFACLQGSDDFAGFSFPFFLGCFSGADGLKIGIPPGAGFFVHPGWGTEFVFLFLVALCGLFFSYSCLFFKLMSGTLEFWQWG